MSRKSLLLGTFGIFIPGLVCLATNNNTELVHKTIEKNNLNYIIAQQQSVPVVIFSQARVPYIVAHIRSAHSDGKPKLLTRANDATQKANRSAACGKFKPTAAEIRAGLTSCDEYPFASTLEGGAGASIAPVPVSEQNSQGGTLSSFYQQNNVPIGGKFFVATGS